MLRVIEQLTLQMPKDIDSQCHNETYNVSIEEPKLDKQALFEVRSEPLSASKRQNFGAFASHEDFVD